VLRSGSGDDPSDGGEATVPSGEIVHVAGAGAFTGGQVANALGQARGVDPTPFRIPVPILPPCHRRGRLGVVRGTTGVFLAREGARRLPGAGSATQARRAGSLEVVPGVGLRKGAAATVKWYREAGWLQ
jgi:hypothetical protein